MIYKITYQDVKTVKSVMRTDDDYKHMYLLEGQIAGFEKEWIDEDIGGIILFQTTPTGVGYLDFYQVFIQSPVVLY